MNDYLKVKLKHIYEVAKTVSFYFVLLSIIVGSLASISDAPTKEKVSKNGQKQEIKPLTSTAINKPIAIQKKAVKPSIKKPKQYSAEFLEKFYVPKEYAKWKNSQISGYEQIIAQGKCKKQFHSADLSLSKSTKQEPVFFYTCEDEGKPIYNIHLKASDIKIGKTKIQNPATKQWAYTQCEERVKKKVNHPSTFNDVSVATETWGNGNRAVYIKAKAKNTFNLELPISATCMFIPAGSNTYAVEVTINGS